jgi:hypothetical protein
MYVLDYILFIHICTFVFTVEGIQEFPGAFFYFVNFVGNFVNFVNFVIFSNQLEKSEKMSDKTIRYITYVEASEMLNISESTFRRKVNNLPKSDLKKLTKREKGRVFINANIVTIFNQIDLNDKIEKTLIEPQKLYKESESEIEYLRKQNEALQNDNRNLVSMVIKLQNDIQGYIKQLGEGEKYKEPITDLIIKIVLIMALCGLLWYLAFG